MKAGAGISRRGVVRGVAGLALGPSLAASRTARAQAPAGERPPVLFVHGDGGTAAQWIPAIWRFESNFYPRPRLFAPDMRLPVARSVDAVREPGRSSAEQATAQLSQEIARVLRQTGAEKLVLVGQGRAGNLIRAHLRGGGEAQVRLAVLCGAPSHGAIISATHMMGSEYNGTTRFLRQLNAHSADAAPGVPLVTLASDRNDLYAQPEGRFLGLPGVATGITFESPAVRGANNLVLQGADHLETAYSAEAFVAMYQAVAGELPQSQEIRPEVRPVLNGRITGWEAGVPTNIPVTGARVRVFAVDPATGMRLGPEVHARVTGPDGAWGPMDGDPEVTHEFEVTVRGHPVTHFYRAPIRRSTEHLHMRPHRTVPEDAPGGTEPGALVLLTRPRGFFDFGRDAIMLGGRRVDGAVDVPHIGTVRLALPPGPQQSVPASYQGEVVVGASWPMAERRVTVIEMTG